MISPKETIVGFIGTGIMGRAMAGHLLKAGYRVHVYSRTKAKAEPLLAMGAVWEDSAAAAAQRSAVIITVVGYPSDVEDLYLSSNGIVARANAGAYLIDMTTSSPSLARRINEAAKARGLHSLDAPVSGGDRGAREASLSIMVGGDEPDFQAVLPLLRLMGKNIVRQGGAGAGQHCKLANQIAIASNMIGVCEALAYAKRTGLNPETVLASIQSGAAGSWSLSNLAPRMLANDFAPGFFVKHFLKDLRIALEEADTAGLDLPGLKLARTVYEKLTEIGGADQGTQALFRLYSGSP